MKSFAKFRKESARLTFPGHLALPTKPRNNCSSISTPASWNRFCKTTCSTWEIGPTFFKEIGQDSYQGIFGVIWDRSIDKDIGNVANQVLPQPALKGYAFPDSCNPSMFADIPGQIQSFGDRFRVFGIHFSLYERAWTLRGMQTLMVDFYDHPKFASELINTIADYNIAQVQEAVKYDIDAVYFGDDWGQQKGLQMGPRLWRKFICPALRRMYAAVHEAGK